VRARLRARLEPLAEQPAITLVLALIRRYRNHNVGMLAAALAYYAAFSLGPLLLILGGWLGVVLRGRPELAEPYRHSLEVLVRQVFPLADDAGILVQQSVDVIVRQLGEGALVRSLLSLVVLLWAASNFFASLQLALERIFMVRVQRGFLRNRLVAVTLVLAVAAFVAVEVVGATLADAAGQLWQALADALAVLDLSLPELHVPAAFGPVRLLASLVVLTLCFRLLPRQHSDWFSALVGGACGAVALALMRQALVAGFSVERINLIYGVVTGVVVLLLWLYLALLVTLLAATLTAELAQRRARLRR
jgi:membrane protein